MLIYTKIQDSLSIRLLPNDQPSCNLRLNYKISFFYSWGNPYIGIQPSERLFAYAKYMYALKFEINFGQAGLKNRTYSLSLLLKKVLYHQIYATFLRIIFSTYTKLEFQFWYCLRGFDSESDTVINLFWNLMWKSVKLHFAVEIKILEFLKNITIVFMGFRIQLCF